MVPSNGTDRTEKGGEISVQLKGWGVAIAKSIVPSIFLRLTRRTESNAGAVVVKHFKAFPYFGIALLSPEQKYNQQHIANENDS